MKLRYLTSVIAVAALAGCAVEPVAEWPAFRMPLQLLVVQGGEEHLSNIQVSGRETVIRIDLPGAAEPSRVVLDPDGWVLKGSR